ncbi:hypothetical protein BHM03_00044674 [Ensete ventricosum]|uniref:Cupin type-1 domain-containing protein n=1 Tax=Ensete ventricosum TaxID=4639 RepID=A0A445ML49_ENSVE|nr:hypothetical protein BHM03_00044674 [Ensete ventricosum]
MGRRSELTLLLLQLLAVASFCSMAVTGYREREIGGEEEVRGTTTSPFKLEKSEQVVKTEGGEVRVVRGFGSSSKWGWGGPVSPMHIGFIFMEPKTLFIPQYLDSSLILFVHRGEVRVGWIYKDGLAERQLKMGDIIHIPAGSTFYMVNAGEGQRLQIICSIDTSESMDFSPYQRIDRRRRKGLLEFHDGDEEDGRWTWRKLLTGILGGGFGDSNRGKKGPVRSPDPYNVYDRDPDFRNDYGWSLALDEHDYHPLKHSDIGVYVVNLTAVSFCTFERFSVVINVPLRDVIVPSGVDDGASREPEGDGVRRGARRIRGGSCGVAQRHRRGVAERSVGVFRVHDVGEEEQTPVPGGGEVDPDGDDGAGAGRRVWGVGGAAEGRGGRAEGDHHSPLAAMAACEEGGEDAGQQVSTASVQETLDVYIVLK